MEPTKDFLRWFLLIGAAPVWVPFLLALWRDFNRALREEGGLFGRDPGPLQLEKMRRERAAEPDNLVSEAWVRQGDRHKPRMGGARPGAKAPPRAEPRFRSGPGTGAPPRRGFR